MLYLEDYLEMVEHLPQELRDRFTEMRELDLSVQNNVDPLEKRIRLFFGQCKRGEMQGTHSDNEFNAIRKDYYKILEDADEKVQLAGQMYDLVERYLRRLDSELYKFKCELEADNNGITEILEKRSLELDGSGNTSTGNQKENRYFGSTGGPIQRDRKYSNYRYKPEKRRDSSAHSEKKHSSQSSTSSSNPMAIMSVPPRPTTPNHNPIVQPASNSSVSYNLQHAGSAIAAAASQAIAATQQLQQGRRTASLKASYEAIHGNAGTAASELLIGRELAGATHNAIQAVEREGTSFSNPRRQKKKLNLASTAPQSSQSAIITPAPAQIMPQTPETPSVVLNDGLIVEQTPEGDWSYDPNEPRYCICNQVSYGDMVACDNEDCPFEWFHYPCVGITQSPKGKWYCPQCTSSMRRRGSRKN